MNLLRPRIKRLWILMLASAVLSALGIIKLHWHSLNETHISKEAEHYLPWTELISASTYTKCLPKPLDLPLLNESIELLKLVVQRMPYATNAGRVREMMAHWVPVIDRSSWRLHSTSGRNFSVNEALLPLLTAGDDSLPVPNFAHFVLPFGNPELQFHHLVCILSCVWVMRPRLLFLWYVKAPTGPNWQLLRANLTAAGLWDSRVVMAHRPELRTVYGQAVHRQEHRSDVMRLEAVLTFGGAYFDLDVITLKPLEPLRRFNFTIGRQSPDGLCNGVFIAVPNCTFLAMWHLAYQTFDNKWWSSFSVNLPHYMCLAFPQFCHIELDSLVKPTFELSQRELIYGKARKWEWRSRNFAMHLWYRFHKKQYDMQSVCRVDSMLGDMFRYVLFGDSSLCG